MKRCTVCRKKTLTGFDCSCGVYLCITHRHPESHNCIDHEKNIINSRNNIEKRLLSAITKDVKVEKI